MTTKIQAIKELNAYLPTQQHNRLVCDLSSFDNWLSENKQTDLKSWLDQLEQDNLLNLIVNLASVALFAGA